MTEPTRNQIAQDYTKALTIINDLREQRDELQAALQACVTMYGPSDLYGYDARIVWEQAEAVLAKASKG